MPSHYWGDEWFETHGKDLYAAIRLVESTLEKFRIGAYGKEKYGTYRENTSFWDGGIHGAIWPGYYGIQNRFIYWELDYYVTKPFTKYTGIHFLVFSIQKIGYNYAFQKACKKYPNVIDELVSDLDYAHLIKPGVFGKIDGQTIVNKYWKKYE